jgi:hypothetical protein
MLPTLAVFLVLGVYLSYLVRTVLANRPATAPRSHLHELNPLAVRLNSAGRNG